MQIFYSWAIISLVFVFFCLKFSFNYKSGLTGLQLFEDYVLLDKKNKENLKMT